MSELSILTADERSLAEQFQLREYFKRHEHHLIFIPEMREIIYKRFKEIPKADWTKNAFASFVQEILRHDDQLFKYVKGVYVAQNEGKNIPNDVWERVCIISSKIVVYMGWECEAKE